jgi:hypothetical protein
MKPNEINLDILEVIIRKSTPKNHRRAKIWVDTKKVKIEITNQESEFSEEDMVAVINHEFLHWIICLMSNTVPRQYDRYLESCGLYYHEVLMENML